MENGRINRTSNIIAPFTKLTLHQKNVRFFVVGNEIMLNLYLSSSLFHFDVCNFF